MSSYHSSFTYLNKNSSGEGFIIASFEPDSGFVDSYLGMDQIVTDSYDGTKKYLYGNRYNTSAEISITIVKPNNSDFSMEENRRVLKWLTGNKYASWLDLYAGDQLVYSFYGNVTSCQQQKLDARVIGIQVTFSSLHPWAWSAPQSFDCYIGDKILSIDGGGEIYSSYEELPYFKITDDGVICNSNSNEDFSFSMLDDGTVYSDSAINLSIDNNSDDSYTLTNLDIVYTNIDSSSLTIENSSLGEKSLITGITSKEVINLNSGQFIISETNPTKIFGDNFNFVWPKLRPGINKLHIDGDGIGKGHVQFTYRYPIKIGDCAIDVDALGRNPMCESDISGTFGSSDGVTRLVRKNVILADQAAGVPYAAVVKDSYLHIDESNNEKHNSFVLLKDNNKVYEMNVQNTSLYLSEMNQVDNNASVRDSILLIDESNGTLYELIVKDDYMHLSEI